MAPTRSNTLLMGVLLIAVIAWRLQDFFSVGMATLDQLEFSTATLDRSLWTVLLDTAQTHGRIYFLLTKIIDYLAAIHATSLVTQTLNLALFAVVPWLLAWMILGDGRERLFFLLIYWTLCTVGWHHTTPAAYPIVLTFPLVLAGAAAAVADRHARSPSRLKLIAYASLAFASFFQYEPTTLVAAVLLLWFIYARIPASPQKRVLYIATAASLGVYAAAYLTWRAIYPSSYDAAVAGDLSAVAIARVLVVYALGALPLPPHSMPAVTAGDSMLGEQQFAYPALSIRSLLPEVAWMDIVFAFAASGLLWILFAERRSLLRNERGGSAGVVGMLLLGLSILIASNILLALSLKYQTWVANNPSPYLTSYYALFGWVVLMTGISRFMAPRWAGTAVVVAFSAVFLYSSASNHFMGKQVRANFSKWQAVDALVACKDHLRAYQSFVLPAAFYGVFGTPPDWSSYWHDWAATSFGSSLRIAPNAMSDAAKPSAYAQPILDDTGKLKAVAGHGTSGGFLIYRANRPNYVWLRHSRDSGAAESGALVMVEDARTSGCREGYRIIEMNSSLPIDSMEVYWHLPGAPSFAAPVSNYPLPVVSETEIPTVIQALYLGFLGRPADPGGLQYWTTEFLRARGKSLQVVTRFAASPETARTTPPDSAFRERVAASYRTLAGRAPRSDETERLSRFENKPDLHKIVAWLVIADLLEAGDRAFLNRLKLAQYYTENLFPTLGWRAEIWEKSTALITDSPESVQKAVSAQRD